jgi:hypothetical protein
MIIAILSVIIGAAGGNKSEDNAPIPSATPLPSAVSSSFSASSEKAYPTGYYNFFPDPSEFTFEEYLLAVEEYSVLHEIKEREEEAAIRASTPYEFKELLTADRVECPTLTPDAFTDVLAIRGGLSQENDV